MNIKRFNMYAGSVIGALLFFLLVNFFANLIYFGPEEGAGEEPEVLAYAVEAEEASGEEPDGGEAGVDWAALLAAADAAAGEKAFAKCKACHSVEPGVNKVGPSLAGVVGRQIASVEGFGYSPALEGLADEAWTLENLTAFLQSPKGFAPGTKMSFSGFKKIEDAINVIVYLNEVGGAPVPLLEEEKKTEAPAAKEDTAAAEEPAAESPATDTAEAPATTGEPDQSAAAAAGTTQAPAAEAPAAEAPAAEMPAATTGEAPAAAVGEAASAAAGAADLLAGADLARGEKVFKKCKACHSLEAGKNKVGPTLYGLIGRSIAGVEGYSYSAAMKAKGGEWTIEALDAFLTKPKEFIPGTKMSFSGLKKPSDRAAVIAYIKENAGSE